MAIRNYFKLLILSCLFISCGSDDKNKGSNDEVCVYELNFVGISKSYVKNNIKHNDVIYSINIDDNCLDNVVNKSSFVAQFRIKFASDFIGKINYWKIDKETYTLYSDDVLNKFDLKYLYLNDNSRLNSDKFDYVDISSNFNNKVFKNKSILLSLTHVNSDRAATVKIDFYKVK